MPMIFPGMDPWLEDPQLWPGVHSRLVVYLADQLQPAIGPRYFAAVEERVYLEPTPQQIIPDVWIRQRKRDIDEGTVAVAETDEPVEIEIPPLDVHESYIEIIDRHSGQRVVTVIEVVSPTNKTAGPGRQSYLHKQGEILRSDTHLVEIDLLRGGDHVVAVPEPSARGTADYDYLVCVNRASDFRYRYQLYPRPLRNRLPRIRIPLAGDDPDVRLDLQAALDRVYDAGEYRDRIDYSKPCQPALRDEDQGWAGDVVRLSDEADSGNS